MSWRATLVLRLLIIIHPDQRVSANWLDFEEDAIDSKAKRRHGHAFENQVAVIPIVGLQESSHRAPSTMRRCPPSARLPS
jgi:hypothetical protein